MNLSAKKKIFFLNLIVGCFVILFIVLRLHNSQIINLRLRTAVIDKKAIKHTQKIATPKTLLNIPWRFHIEEDGFVFPITDKKERFLTYEQLNGSWTKQIMQFENAIVFAYLLKRTVLVPPLRALTNAETNRSEESTRLKASNVADINNTDSFSMSKVIDFDLLSSVVKIGEMDSSQINQIKYMNRYDVCHDPRLGFWLDYIPSMENIHTWRLLKEQYFSPLKLNLNGLKREYVCPGTANYRDRWGPPLRMKPVYRGILTELYKRTEDLIYFQGDTLDTTHIRFFNKERVKKAQELLLFYIRFSKSITKQTKRLANMLGFGYTAVLANHLSDTDGISSYIVDEVQRQSFKNVSKNIFIVTKSRYKYVFTKLIEYKFNIIFADTFLEENFEHNERIEDKEHILSLLLCAYATHFIGLPGTSDLYFVEHLRLQDASMVDGLVTDKVSVRWAKHTVRDKADEKKVLLKTTKKISTIKLAKYLTPYSINGNLTIKGPEKKAKVKTKNKLDRLTTMVCSFCNYVSYVTGQHGCPNMNSIC